MDAVSGEHDFRHETPGAGIALGPPFIPIGEIPVQPVGPDLKSGALPHIPVLDEQILKKFASRQEYVWINGSPMPLLFEGFAESNSIENIDGDRFFVSKYALKILGFIQDEKEFEIVKTTRKPRIGYNTSI